MRRFVKPVTAPFYKSPLGDLPCFIVQKGTIRSFFQKSFNFLLGKGRGSLVVFAERIISISRRVIHTLKHSLIEAKFHAGTVKHITLVRVASDQSEWGG